MYALVVTVAVESAGDPEEMRRDVEEKVIPRVRMSPGAIAGHWLAPVRSGGNGMSVIFFENRENAEAAAAAVPDHPAPGVTRLGVEVRERFTGF